MRANEIRRKEMAMQARTGNANLSSSFGFIQNKLKRASDIYGSVRDFNQGMTFHNIDQLESA